MAVWIVSVILATVAVIVVQIKIATPFGDYYPVKNSGILVLINFLASTCIFNNSCYINQHKFTWSDCLIKKKVDGKSKNN